jgi:hypothetical protein
MSDMKHLAPKRRLRRAGIVVGAGVLCAELLGVAFVTSDASAQGTQGIDAVALRGCGPAVLSALQANTQAQLTSRVTQLQALQSEVGESTTLSGPDRSTLTTDLANELTGIQALQSKVAADTTCAVVRADRRAMVVNYRVFVVMTPQVHLSLSADTASYVISQFNGTIEPQLVAAINSAQSAGKNVTLAREEDSELVAQVNDALSSVTSVNSVLSFTPASYPSCWSTFVSDRTTLHTADLSLRHADRLLHQIVRRV